MIRDADEMEPGQKLQERSIREMTPTLGLSMDPRSPNRLFVCLFVFESCLTALERTAEWKTASIHRPNLLVRRGKGTTYFFRLEHLFAAGVSWERQQG